MKPKKKSATAGEQAARQAIAHPTRDDGHEQRVPDQAQEGSLERQDPETELKRPPTADEAGSH